jgi:hypothetical protein
MPVGVVALWFQVKHWEEMAACPFSLDSILVNALYAVAVFQSTDGGGTFNWAYMLSHETPAEGSGINFDHPRMESPGVAFDSRPVLQQYVDGQQQKMLYFETPPIPQ